MKKALCFVLGAMLMAMLPGSAKAQSKNIALDVRTLDHAAIEAAWVFAGADTAEYFVDSAHLSGVHTNLVWIDTVATRAALSIEGMGFTLTGTVDSATFAKGAVVVIDTNNRVYVYGGSNQTERANGTIKVATLFTAANTLEATLTVADNVLMPYEFAVKDNLGWSYSNLADAIANAEADTITFVADVVNVPNTITVDREVTVMQIGKSLAVQADTAFSIVSGVLTWNGGNGAITTTATPGKIFNVSYGLVWVNGVNATAGNIINVNGSIISGALVNNSTFNVTGADQYAIEMSGLSALQVDSVNFAGGASGVKLADDFSGVAKVLASTVNNRMSSYAVPVVANAYAVDGNYRVFFRSLKKASNSVPMGSMLHLSRNIPAGENDTIDHAVVLLFEGDSIKSELNICHSNGTVILNDGFVNIVSTDTANSSNIQIDSIDVNANFMVNSHTVVINNGRFNNIDIANATPQTLTINGGKFAGAPRATLQQFLYNGKGFGVNTDADAARFPWKVINGYTVTWANWDNNGATYDTVYSNANRKISPVFNRNNINMKDGVDLDTLFIGWYIDDVTFNTPWNFPTDELVQDTTLYAKYIVVDRNVTTEYTVRHLRQNLARTGYDTANVFTYADSTGHSLTLMPALYYGYTCTVDNIVIDNLQPGLDTTFYYNRSKVPVVWAAGEGYVDGNAPNHFTNDTLYFGDTIDYSAHFATREGYTFTGWDTTHITVHYSVDTIWAEYIQNTYPVTWKIAGTDAESDSYSTPYTAAAFDQLTAVYTDDNSNIVDANLTFIKGNDTISTPDYPVNGGTWAVTAYPVNPAYLLANNTFTLTITPATLTVTGVAVDTVKFYDGNRLTNVTNRGGISGVLGSDFVEYNVIAMYDTPEVGEGKAITATYSVVGVLGANYIFASNNDTLTRNGVILEAIVPDNNFGDTNTGIQVDASGYCTGNGIINYQLTSGDPDQYKLSFSDSTFADTNWQSIATAGQIVIDVPEGIDPGTYEVTVVFGDSRFPQLVSNPITVSFNVNMPETYTKAIFKDVIALIDTASDEANRFTNVRWYQSTDNGASWNQRSDADDKYFLQEPDSLFGWYKVEITWNGHRIMSCPQTDFTALNWVADSNTQTTVDAYPNPATDQVTIRVNGSNARTHSVRVMSVMGLCIENRVFEGNELCIDLRGLQAGNYVVSVDGIVVRVIKK